MELKELLEARAKKVSDARALVNRAKDQKRDLTADERQKIDGLIDEASDFTKQIDRVNDSGRRDDRLSELEDRLQDEGRRVSDPPDPGREHEDWRFIDQRTGREIKAYAGGPKPERIGAKNDSERLNIGLAIRGLITGERNGATREFKNLQQSDSNWTLTHAFSRDVIDEARNVSAAVRAGARTIPMSTQELSVARIVSAPVAHWRHEGVPIEPSDGTFDIFTLHARTLAFLFSVTVEAAQDAPNIVEEMRRAAAEGTANELDRVAFFGSGAGAEPQGLYYAEGVNETLAVGAPTWDDVLSGINDIEMANGEPNAAVFSPRDIDTLRKLKDSEGRYLEPPEAVRNLPKYVTNQVPTNLGGGTESAIFVGDFSNMLIGMRTNLTIEVFDSGTVNGREAMQEMRKWVRGYLRADIAFVRPNHFSRLLGVT